MTQSNPDFELPVMPLPPEPPPEDDFPCCTQRAPSCCKSGSSDLLTASEVKVLTETATRVAYRLGRKDALTEIADEMALEQEYLSYTTFQTDRDTALLLMAAKTPPQAPGAASDATSGVPGHPEVSEAVRSPQEPGEGL